MIDEKKALVAIELLLKKLRRHRETLQRLVTKGTDGIVYLCTDLTCEAVLREREPWLFEEKS